MKVILFGGNNSGWYIYIYLQQQPTICQQLLHSKQTFLMWIVCKLILPIQLCSAVHLYIKTDIKLITRKCFYTTLLLLLIHTKKCKISSLSKGCKNMSKVVAVQDILSFKSLICWRYLIGFSHWAHNLHILQKKNTRKRFQLQIYFKNKPQELQKVGRREERRYFFGPCDSFIGL